MAPDLEWRVDDPSGQQTIAKTTPPRSPRWRRWAIGLMVLLGVALGVLYRSIPEPARPAPTPTPLPTQITPTPTAMPAALYQTVAREATALAEGNRAALDRVVDIPDFERYQAVMGSLEPWGKPTDAALYSILDFRLTTKDKAWVKIKQFRVKDYVEETRFYRLRNGEWRRTDFDPAFWSGRTETSDTPHYRFIYHVEDHDLIAPVARLLEDDYEQLCTDFACARWPMSGSIYTPDAYAPICAFGYCSGPEKCAKALGEYWCSAFPREITVTYKLTADLSADELDISDSGDLTATLASPRSSEQLAPLEREGYFRNGTAWLFVMRLAYGRVDFQGPPPPGRILAVTIFYREYNQLLKRTGSEPIEMPPEFTQLDTKNLPTLDVIWNEAADTQSAQPYAIANSVITYIEQEFGWPAVVKLLKAIGPSKSLAEAIETGTGQSYVQFEKDWQAWVESNTPTTP